MRGVPVEPTIERVPATRAMRAARRSGGLLFGAVLVVSLAFLAGGLAILWMLLAWGASGSLQFEGLVVGVGAAFGGGYLTWATCQGLRARLRQRRDSLLRTTGPIHVAYDDGGHIVLYLHGGQIHVDGATFAALGAGERQAVVDHDPDYREVYEVRDLAGKRLYPAPAPPGEGGRGR